MAEFKSTIDTGNVLRNRTSGVGRPVEDRSAEIIAGAINRGIEAGEQVAEAVSRAPLENEIQGDLEDFSEAKLQNTPADLYVQLTDAAQQVDSLEEGGADPVALNEAKTEFERLDRLRRLGNMSASQVQLMAEAKLRNYVNDNPFYREELIDSHDTILGLHRKELAAIQALDARQNQSDQFLFKQYAQIAIDNGLDVLGKDTQELAAMVSPIMFNKAAYERFQRITDMQEQEAINMFYGTESNALNGAYNTFVTDITSEMRRHRDGTTTIEEYNFNIQSLAQTYKTSLLRFNRWIPQEHINQMEETFDNATVIAENAVKLDKSAEWAQNRLKIEESNILNEALQDDSMKVMYVAKELLPDWVENNILFQNNADLAKALINYSTNLKAGRIGNMPPPTNPSGRRITKEAGNAMRDAYSTKKPQTQEEWNEVHDMVGSMADIVSQRSYTQEEMQNVLQTGAMPEVAEFVNNSPEYQYTAEKLRRGTESLLAETLVPQLGVALNKRVNVPIRPTFTGRHKGEVREYVLMDVNETGRIAFSLKDVGALTPKEQTILRGTVDQLNRGLAVDINNASRTLAHVNGSTDYRASTEALLNRFNMGQLPEMTGVDLIPQIDEANF